MKVALSLLLICSVFSSAEAFDRQKVTIHDVVTKTNASDSFIVKFTDGRVAFLDDASPETGRNIKALIGRSLEAEISEDNKLLDWKVLPGFALPVSAEMKINIDPDPFSYTPTVYASYAEATEALNSFRRDALRDAQCYDKAHVWAYEENYNYRTKLMKAFLFFSDAYIQRTNHPWWFHVAPYAHVRMSGVVNERIMDAHFAQYPLKFQLWTDLFMKNKAVCKVVTKYSDYSQHPGEDDCYVMKTHMYFWQPRDLEAFETNGFQKTKFIEWEIRHSYLAGFGRSL